MAWRTTPTYAADCPADPAPAPVGSYPSGAQSSAVVMHNWPVQPMNWTDTPSATLPAHQNPQVPLQLGTGSQTARVPAAAIGVGRWTGYVPASDGRGLCPRGQRIGTSFAIGDGIPGYRRPACHGKIVVDHDTTSPGNGETEVPWRP